MDKAKSANKFMLFLLLYIMALPLIAMPIVFVLTLCGVSEDLQGQLLLFFQHFLCFGIPLAFLKVSKNVDILSLIPHKRLNGKNILLIIAIQLCFTPVMYLMAAISNVFFENDTSDVIMQYMDSVPFWVLFMAVAVFAPIFEEVVFRGVIFSGFKKEKLWVGVLISSLYFGIMHLNAQQFLYATVAGLVLAIVVHYTESIYASIIVHFFVNGGQLFMAKLATAFFPAANVSSDLITMEEKLLLVKVCAGWTVLTLPMLAVALSYFINYNKQRLEDEALENEPDEELDIILLREEKKTAFYKFFWLVIVFYLVYMIGEALLGEALSSVL